MYNAERQTMNGKPVLYGWWEKYISKGAVIL
jgi:hypothetical protein